MKIQITTIPATPETSTEQIVMDDGAVLYSDTNYYAVPSLHTYGRAPTREEAFAALAKSCIANARKLIRYAIELNDPNLNEIILQLASTDPSVREQGCNELIEMVLP